MNIFEYRRKADLTGRTDTYRANNVTRSSAARPEPPSAKAAAKPETTAAQNTAKVAEQKVRGRRRPLRNGTKDRWYYSSNLQTFQQQVSGGNKNESAALEDETQQKKTLKFIKLMGDDRFEGEQIKEIYRRHPIHIFFLAKPLWFLLPFTFILMIVALFINFLWLGVVPLMLINLLFIIWYVNDWSNDYLLLTSRRVILLERVTFIDDEKTEIPTEKVQETRIATRRGAIEFLFRVGTVTFVSTSKTQIVFQRLKKPEELRGVVEGMTKSFMIARGAYRKERTLNYLRNKALNEPLIDYNAKEDSRIKNAIEAPGWWERNFPSLPVLDAANKRYIWHTHPWFLFKKVFWHSFMFVVMVIVGIIGLPFLIRLALPGWLIAGILILYVVILLVQVFLFWYKYEDWLDDRFIITYGAFQEKVMNIKKLPFGFDETVNTVLIRNIQDVQSIKPGLLANFLNYGTVKVSVTGGSGVEFVNVPDPENIRDEISRYIELAKFAQEDADDRRNADVMIGFMGSMLQDFSRRLGVPPSQDTK